MGKIISVKIMFAKTEYSGKTVFGNYFSEVLITNSLLFGQKKYLGHIFGKNV